MRSDFVYNSDMNRLTHVTDNFPATFTHGPEPDSCAKGGQKAVNDNTLDHTAGRTFCYWLRNVTVELNSPQRDTGAKSNATYMCMYRQF